MTENLAVALLQKNEETIADYDGHCGELVDGIIHWLGEDRVSILYLKPSNEIEGLITNWDVWRYHMVALIDGFVHDAWFPKLVLPPGEYIAKAFPGQKVIPSFH